MGKLIYSFFTSLDGYVADETGNFDWAEPDEEVHSFANDLERPIGTYLYGRKLYEMMAVWETPEVFPSAPPAVQEYARIWQAAEKVVYSRTLSAVSTARTRIERAFDVATLRDLKARSERDLCIGGPHLAAEAIRAGLVDEYGVYIAPVVVGGGNPFLPEGARRAVELIEERRFRNGMIYLHYRESSRAIDEPAANITR